MPPVIIDINLSNPTVCISCSVSLKNDQLIDSTRNVAINLGEAWLSERDFFTDIAVRNLRVSASKAAYLDVRF